MDIQECRKDRDEEKNEAHRPKNTHSLTPEWQEDGHLKKKHKPEPFESSDGGVVLDYDDDREKLKAEQSRIIKLFTPKQQEKLNNRINQEFEASSSKIIPDLALERHEDRIDGDELARPTPDARNGPQRLLCRVCQNIFDSLEGERGDK
jgi:hypothetical protein